MPPIPVTTDTTLSEEIANYLAANGIGTVSEDIFVGHFTVDPDSCTMIFGAGAAEQEKYLDTQYTVVDVWTRSQSSKTKEGELRLYTIYQLLHQMQNYPIGDNFYVYFAYATSQVQDMDRDNQQRKLLKITFRFMYRDMNMPA
jgi:hypothetical protein